MYHINIPVKHMQAQTDRSLQTGQDVLLLRQIVRDLKHALSHRHDYTWTAFVEPVVSNGGNSSIAP